MADWTQFEEWYADEAEIYWNEAAADPNGIPLGSTLGAAEHDGNRTSESVIQDTAEKEVIVSLDELRVLSGQQISKQRLHREARGWLDHIANGDHGDQRIMDLTNIWSNWKSWLATQPESTQAFQCDVAAFTAEAIENTRDPNRGGRPRVDFCAKLVDGSY